MLSGIALISFLASEDFQKWTAIKASSLLSKELDTEFSLQSLKIDWGAEIELSEILIRDQENDTLLYIEKLNLDAGLLSLLEKEIHVEALLLQNIKLNLRQIDSSIYNFSFLFPPPDTSKKNSFDWPIYLDQAELNTIDFSLVSEQSNIKISNKNLLLDGSLLLKERKITAGNLSLLQPDVYINVFPDSTETTVNNDSIANILMPDIGWHITNETLELTEGHFVLNSVGTSRTEGKFDPKHMNFSDINININSVNWEKSALQADIEKVAFAEHSGIAMHHLKTRAELSDTAIRLQNFETKTAHSELSLNAHAQFYSPADLYQLHKDNAFQIELINSHAGINDLSLFIDSAILDQLPDYKIDGKINGTLAALNTENLKIKIGKKSHLHLNGKLKNLLHTDSISWEVNSIDLAAYKSDINTYLKNQLGEEIFYYTHYTLKGRASGNLSTVNLQNTVLQAGNALWLKLDGNYTHSATSTGRSGNISLDLRQLTNAAFRPFAGENEWLSALEKFRLKGNIELQNDKSNTDLTLQSSAGILNIKGNALINDAFMPEEYAFSLDSENFDLAKLPLDTALKNISFSAKLNGKGLHPDTLAADLQMAIHQLHYKNHKWKQIDLEAKWQNNQLQSKLNVNDTMAGLQLTAFWKPGELDSIALNWNVDSFLVASVSEAYDKMRVASKGEISYSGDFNQKHAARGNIQNFSIEDSAITLHQKDTKFWFEQTDSSRSKGNINSEILSANWDGPGTPYWKKLPNMAIAMADKYFPIRDLLGVKRVVFDKQILDAPLQLKLTFSQPAKWASLFLPELNQLDTLGLEMNWQPGDTAFTLNLFTPDLDYSGMGWQQMSIRSLGQKTDFNFLLRLDSVFVKDKISLNRFEFESNVLNDSLFSAINIWDDSSNNTLSINNLYTKEKESNRFKLYFREPFVLNQKEWNVDPGNFIYLGAEDFDFEPLILSRENQQFSIGKQKGKSNALNMNMQNISIREITKILSFEEPDLQGNINASVVFTFSPEIEVDGDINITNLFIENSDAGSLDITASLIDNLATFDASLRGPNGQMQAFGEYNVLDNTINASADVPKLPVAFITAFLPEYVDSSSGHLSAKAKIKGSITKPVFSGKLDLNEVRSWIVPLQTYYTLDGKGIEIDNKQFLVKNLDLKDRYGSTGSIQGSVLHQNFSKLELFLQMKAKDFTFFEIPKNDKEFLSGTLRLDLDAKVRGSLEQPVVNLNAKTRETTDLLVSLIDEQQAIAQEDYVFYYDPERVDSTTKEKLLFSETGFSLFMNLQATNEAQLQIIVDPISGDYLELNGNSNLSVEIEPNKTPVVTGTYTVKSGSYRFSYEQVLKKRFNIQEDSKINFTGDPMEAQLDINAIYSTETTTYELIEDQSATLSSSENEAARKKSKVNVFLKIGGVLSKPELSFDIQIPGGQSNIASAVTRRLTQLREDEAELNKQVFGLLLFNSFISSGGGGDIGSSGEAAALNSVSKLINNQLNNLAGKHVKAIDISFAFDAYKDRFAETDKTIAEVGLDLSKSFLDNRLSVKIGGNLNLENESVSAEEAQAMQQVSNDFVVEYKLTENGRYRVKVFQTANYDLINNNNVFRTGAGVSFHETFGKIFRDEQEKEAKKKTKEKEEADEED
ncbi:MAG: translocation/assembly module TamB domain-containing protein [Chitinophagales bacterium]